jgi:hypothetical protein
MTITWTSIQNQYAANAADHFERAQALGLGHWTLNSSLGAASERPASSTAS